MFFSLYRYICSSVRTFIFLLYTHVLRSTEERRILLSRRYFHCYCYYNYYWYWCSSYYCYNYSPANMLAYTSQYLELRGKQSRSHVRHDALERDVKASLHGLVDHNAVVVRDENTTADSLPVL